MKHWTYILTHAAAAFFIGVLVSIPFNHWYTANFVKGEEGVGPHLLLSVFVYWPLLLFIGGWIGHRRFNNQKN